MQKVSNKEELKKGIDKGEKEFVVTDKKLLKALAVRYWVQENKVKGTLLMAALPAAIAAGVASAPLLGVVGAGLAVGGTTLGATEILIIGGTVIVLVALLKGQEIESIDITKGTVKFK